MLSTDIHYTRAKHCKGRGLKLRKKLTLHSHVLGLELTAKAQVLSEVCRPQRFPVERSGLHKGLRMLKVAKTSLEFLILFVCVVEPENLEF